MQICYDHSRREWRALELLPKVRGSFIHQPFFLLSLAITKLTDSGALGCSAREGRVCHVRPLFLFFGVSASFVCRFASIGFARPFHALGSALRPAGTRQSGNRDRLHRDGSRAMAGLTKFSCPSLGGTIAPRQRCAACKRRAARPRKKWKPWAS
jgi:hypothetical protein